MINYIKFILIFIFSVNSALAGVTVLGTRFYMLENTKSVNIKVMNDNESDYLIKTNIQSKDFVVYPPLFVLQKNSSNIITVIPQGLLSKNEDRVYDLTVSAIPRSAPDFDKNKVSLAVRSHFKLIYFHSKPEENIYDNLKIIKSSDGEWMLMNPTQFVFLVSISANSPKGFDQIKILRTRNHLPLKTFCSGDKCVLNLNFFDTEGNSIIKKNLAS